MARNRYIEKNWGEDYIQSSKAIILNLVSTIYRHMTRPSSQPSLMQMRQYHSPRPMPASSVPGIFSVPQPVNPLPPTMFSVEFPDFDMDPSTETPTVEGEYARYAASTSSRGTDILQFWEVSKFYVIE
jgi:hypothetical protein